MPIVKTPGIYLPNGNFLPNEGDGHAKNAMRFCERYKELGKLCISSILPADEFLLEAGCAIVAGYRGTHCFKIAEDNDFLEIAKLKAIYEHSGYEIWPYWKINPESKRALFMALNSTCDGDVEPKAVVKTEFISKSEMDMHQRYSLCMLSALDVVIISNTKR